MRYYLNHLCVGPPLFVLHINDLPDLTKSNTFLVIDDIKIFRHLKIRIGMATVYFNRISTSWNNGVTLGCLNVTQSNVEN